MIARGERHDSSAARRVGEATWGTRGGSVSIEKPNQAPPPRTMAGAVVNGRGTCEQCTRAASTVPPHSTATCHDNSHLRMGGDAGAVCYRQGQRWTRSPRRVRGRDPHARARGGAVDGQVLELVTDSRTRFRPANWPARPDLLADASARSSYRRLTRRTTRRARSGRPARPAATWPASLQHSGRDEAACFHARPWIRTAPPRRV